MKIKSWARAYCGLDEGGSDHLNHPRWHIPVRIATPLPIRVFVCARLPCFSEFCTVNLLIDNRLGGAGRDGNREFKAKPAR